MTESKNDKRHCHHFLLMINTIQETGSRMTTNKSKTPTMLSKIIVVEENKNVKPSKQQHSNSGNTHQYFRTIFFMPE